MSNTCGNINHYLFEKHKEAFTLLLDVFNAFQLNYFLIGAQARDIHFLSKGIEPSRGTRDIDFAVMVDSIDQYNALINALKAKGFEETKDPFRLNWKKGETVIDLLPFGQIEENYTVSFNEREIELFVLGYKELNEELEEFYLDEYNSVSIPVLPIHGLFILKLISWDNSKYARDKDLSDLFQILNNFWEFAENEAYEKHSDLFDDNFEISKAAARILGRHLKKTLNKSKVLKEQILKILEEQTATAGQPGLLLQKFAGYSDKPIEEIKSLIDEIIKGIIE